MFLQWLDNRTGIPFLFNKIANWTVTDRRCPCRFFPAAILFTFVLQAITGVFLWAYYSPSATSAWESLFYLQFHLPGGWLIRGIHHFAAQLLTVLLGFYLLGLVFSGRYRTPREFVFWSAFILFLLSLCSSLTGDLLSWTLSGFSATLVRVRFLQMIPLIGGYLFKIVASGAEFGTLTLPRFLVLHILVFGGGFFAFAVLWRFFDYRARGGTCSAVCSKDGGTSPAADKVSFWSCEVVKTSLVWLLVMLVVLLLNYRQPVLHKITGKNAPQAAANLPREAHLGVHLGAPADPSSFYDAARPEWSFRSLYHFCNLKISGKDVFPGEKKFIPVFVVTGIFAAYIFLIPVIGRVKAGHYLNVLVVAFLFVSLSYLTYASYHHDYFEEEMAGFRSDEAAAERLAERTVQLCLAEGIPPTGALSVAANDPFLRGPELYKQHCAVCHPFQPLDGEQEHADFAKIPCDTLKAPNLYRPLRKEWVGGFLSDKKIRNDDYFGKTKFKQGTMSGFVRSGLKEILDEDEENPKKLEQLVDLLVAEAERDKQRTEKDGKVDGLTEEQTVLFEDFTCGQCHKIYASDEKPAIQAPDLRGYFSRNWLIEFIADPETSRFYGKAAGKDKGNDGMPAFKPEKGEAVLTQSEIEIIVDWLRGNWKK
ncbi:MAG: cytochrome b N-terminal domain-containing protein [Planctomycetaceae bacterium]|jgi:ubiquinol-cytochrome c reductase cytochrome b subunit|nr:cytochrome b N-terminal domain-containing protein [Planctomycetaceae bacterium]